MFYHFSELREWNLNVKTKSKPNDDSTVWRNLYHDEFPKRSNYELNFHHLCHVVQVLKNKGLKYNSPSVHDH